MTADHGAAGPVRGAVVNHVGQCTTDLARAQRFYVEALGFEFERALAVPDEAAAALLGVAPPVGLRAVYLRRGDFVLELMAFDRAGNPERAARVMNEPGLTHVSIAVDAIDQAVAAVLDLGGEVVFQSPQAAMVRDPDGQLLELLPMAYRRRIDADRAARAPGADPAAERAD